MSQHVSGKQGPEMDGRKGNLRCARRTYVWHQHPIFFFNIFRQSSINITGQNFGMISRCTWRIACIARQRCWPSKMARVCQHHNTRDSLVKLFCSCMITTSFVPGCQSSLRTHKIQTSPSHPSIVVLFVWPVGRRSILEHAVEIQTRWLPLGRVAHPFSAWRFLVLATYRMAYHNCTQTTHCWFSLLSSWRLMMIRDQRLLGALNSSWICGLISLNFEHDTPNSKNLTFVPATKVHLRWRSLQTPRTSLAHMLQIPAYASNDHKAADN